MKDIIIIAFYVVLIVFAVLITRWTINSDLPFWVKFVLLR